MKLPKNLSARQMLRFDLAGAVLSALLLGIVLPIWQPVFGIPLSVLYTLAALPIGSALFDGYALSRPAAGQRSALRTVAGLNVGYCGISLLLAALHHAQLTTLGWVYLFGEITLVLFIALVERRLAARLEGG